MLVQNHTKGPFDPKYVGDYQVVAIRGNQEEIRPSVAGPTEIKHIKHVKYILPVDRSIKQIPDYNAFGRKATLTLNPDKIPDLHWSLADSYHTTNIGLTISNTIAISINYIDINTLSYAKGDKYKKWCGMSLSTGVNIVQSNIKPIVCSTIKYTKDNNGEPMTRN